VNGSTDAIKSLVWKVRLFPEPVYGRLAGCFGVVR